MAQSVFARTRLGGSLLTDWLTANKLDLTLAEKIFDEHLERQGVYKSVVEITRHYKLKYLFGESDVTIDADPTADPLRIPTMVNVPGYVDPESLNASVLKGFDEQAPVTPAQWDHAMSESRESGFDLITFLRQQRHFSLNAFGPADGSGPVTYDSITDHIRKELIEIEAGQGRDLAEWMDVVILGLDGAWRCAVVQAFGHGERAYSPREIALALNAKLEQNKARTWPDWRTKRRDGKAIEHIRDQEIEMPTVGKDLEIARLLRKCDALEESERVTHQRLDSALEQAASWEKECRHVEAKLAPELALERERLADAVQQVEAAERANVTIAEENLRLGNVVNTQNRIISQQLAELARLQRVIDEQDLVIRDRNQRIARLEARESAPSASIDVRTPPARRATDAGIRDYYGGPHNPYEAIKVIEACRLNFNLGNTVKYILRPGKSLTWETRAEDLTKAMWYLEREINALKANGAGATGVGFSGSAIPSGANSTLPTSAPPTSISASSSPEKFDGDSGPTPSTKCK